MTTILGEMCHVCKVKEHCGKLLIPCMHYLCKMCLEEEGDPLGVCPVCKMTGVQLKREEEVIEKGKFADAEKRLGFLNENLEYSKNLDALLNSKRKRVEEEYEKEKSRLDQVIERNSNEMEKYESAIQFINRVTDKKSRPSEILLKTEGQLITSTNGYRSPEFIDFSRHRLVLEGKTGNLFSPRCAAASNSLGQIFVCDNNRVKVFSPDGILKKSIGNIGGKLSNKITNPTCIDVDSEDRLYVAGDGSIKILNKDATQVILEVKEECDDKYKHMVVAVSRNNGNIIALGSMNSRAMIFSKEGKLLRRFCEKGKEANQFGYPERIAVNSKNQIFISDWEKNGVHVFDEGGNHLKFMGGLKRARGLCVDRHDNLYVLNGSLHFLKVFDVEGRLIREVERMMDSDAIDIAIHSTTGSVMLTVGEHKCVYIY